MLERTETQIAQKLNSPATGQSAEKQALLRMRRMCQNGDYSMSPELKELV